MWNSSFLSRRCLKGIKVFKFKKLPCFYNSWYDSVFKYMMFESIESMTITLKGQMDNACELHEFSRSIQDHLFMVPCMSYSIHVSIYCFHWIIDSVIFVDLSMQYKENFSIRATQVGLLVADLDSDLTAHFEWPGP